MKIFIGYQHTGFEVPELREFFDPICNTLRTYGHDPFCALEQDQAYKKLGLTDWEAKLGYCLTQVEEHKRGLFLAVVRTNMYSIGMEREVAKAKKTGVPIKIARQAGVALPQFLNGQTRYRIVFKDKHDLLHQLVTQLSAP